MKPFTTIIKELKDEKYKKFTEKLVPNIRCECIIGVSVPKLRALAKKLLKERKEECELFLKESYHKSLEENILHAFFICEIKDINTALLYTEKFLPYIDNWIVCDVFLPKIFGKYLDIILEKIKIWIQEKKPFVVRFAIGLLLRYFLDDAFNVEYLSWVAKIESDEYYVNMMRAWFFAEALVKQQDVALLFLRDGKLPQWVHNKTIQKACESRRISDSFKIELKKMKIKKTSEVTDKAI